MARACRPPVAIPEDVDDPSVVKASGAVELPFHVRWSDPPITYDLGNEPTASVSMSRFFAKARG